MFPENFALYTSQKQVDLRDFEQCLYQVKKKQRWALAAVFKATFMKTVTISRAAIVQCTVGPRSVDTRLIRTPVYNGQFLLSRRKADIFSLKLTRLIRTLVKTDNGHLFTSRVTFSHTSSTSLYGHWLSAHWVLLNTLRILIILVKTYQKQRRTF